jgi:hypothetical protein
MPRKASKPELSRSLRCTNSEKLHLVTAGLARVRWDRFALGRSLGQPLTEEGDLPAANIPGQQESLRKSFLLDQTREVSPVVRDASRAQIGEAREHRQLRGVIVAALALDGNVRHWL